MDPKFEAEVADRIQEIHGNYKAVPRPEGNNLEAAAQQYKMKLEFQRQLEESRRMQQEGQAISGTRAILNERGKTHGSFKINSSVSVALKNAFIQGCQQSGKTELITEVQEGLSMVLHKISRIAAGDPYELDHYRDIMGYTQLMIDAISKMKEDREFYAVAGTATRNDIPLQPK